MTNDAKKVAKLKRHAYVCLTYSIFMLVGLICCAPFEFNHLKRVWGSEARWSEQKIEAFTTALKTAIPEKEHQKQIEWIIRRVTSDAKMIRFRSNTYISLYLSLLGTASLTAMLSWRFLYHLRQCPMSGNQNDTESGIAANDQDAGAPKP